MDYLIDLKKQNLSGKVALEGGISLGVDTDGNIKKIDESGAISDIGGSVDESRLLPENPANGDIPVYDATATGGGIDEYTQACFHFDETDGSFKNAVDGSAEYLESTATYSAQGKFDGAAEFSGSQRIKYSKTTALNWGTDQGTVDGWFYPNGIQNSSNALIATPGGWSSGGISIGYDRSNTRKKFSVWMKEASGDMAWSSTEEYPRNAWYHWALVRASSTELLFFLNGKKIGTIEIDADREINWAINGGYCSIGYNEADGSGIIGRMDEVRFSNTARWTEDFTPPAVPYSEQVAEGRWGKMSSSGLVSIAAPANGDIPCFDATATVGGGNDAHTKILLHFDADEIKDEAAGNAAPVTITKKSGTITIVEGGKWGKCAKYVTGSMTVATNLDELNANNWVVSGWFNPDENNHGVSYPTWLSMDDQNTHGFGFDSTGRYGESDGPLFYLDTPPASGTWHWLAIVKYSGGLRFYLNGAFLNEISAQQRANFCSTLAIGGFAGTYAVGSTERTFSGLVDEVRLQYIPDDEITLWTGTSIAVPDAPYSKPQTVGEWGKFNKSLLAQKSDVLPEWHQLSGSSAITLDRANGELQKVTLTQNCTLTAPTLDADHPTMLLQVTSSSAVTVAVGETQIWSGSGTFQVGWFYDGETTRRYPVVEVA